VALLITGAAALLVNRFNQTASEQPATGKTESAPDRNMGAGDNQGAKDPGKTENATNAAPYNKAEGNKASDYTGHAGNESEATNNNAEDGSGVELKEPVSNDIPTDGLADEQNDAAHNIGADLHSFGIREEAITSVAGEAADLEDNKFRLANNIVPPNQPLGSKFLIGVGVGQMVSKNGISINPKYREYVHKDFAKNMRDGEGLLSAMSFSGSLGYNIGGNNYLFSGVSYYQRRNSVRFNFEWNPPVTDNTNGEEADKNGNYPIKDYNDLQIRKTEFTGTNIFTEFDIPIGWFGQFEWNKKYTFIPSVSANLGFLSIDTRNVTLDYAAPRVVGVNRAWYRNTFALMSASAGIYRNIGPSLKWGLNVSGNYTLTQMYEAGSTIRPRAFTSGLNTQLIWRLY
jgi:hypothetical protein